MDVMIDTKASCFISRADALRLPFDSLVARRIYLPRIVMRIATWLTWLTDEGYLPPASEFRQAHCRVSRKLSNWMSLEIISSGS